tara:strand:- start:476 stop:616 length:141 start_codon:yes stop_codon:yes gene_type:complete
MKKTNNFLRTFYCFLFLIIIQGCGQTGDLYLPEEANYINKKNEFRT